MRLATLAAAACLTFASTITLAQSVTYDFDRGANFSSFKTYAWTRGTELGDELNHARIVRAIDTQLAAKGLTRVDASASPDVLVAYHASFDRNLQINAFASGPRFAGMRSGTATTQEILTGTLVVDVMNGASAAVLWRGIATGEIDRSAKPDKRDRNISKTAEKLFRNYPPKQK